MAVHAHGSNIQFAVGDRVVCLKNDHRLDVDNGTRATVTAVDPTWESRSAPTDATRP